MPLCCRGCGAWGLGCLHGWDCVGEGEDPSLPCDELGVDRGLGLYHWKGLRRTRAGRTCLLGYLALRWEPSV